MRQTRATHRELWSQIDRLLGVEAKSYTKTSDRLRRVLEALQTKK